MNLIYNNIRLGYLLTSMQNYNKKFFALQVNYNNIREHAYEYNIVLFVLCTIILSLIQSYDIYSMHTR